LDVDLEVGLHKDGTIEQTALAVLLEGEVVEELADSEVRRADSADQPDHFQFLDDLFLILVNPVALPRLGEGEAEDVLDDRVVLGASLKHQEALDEDRDLVLQWQPDEVKVLLAEPHLAAYSALAQDLVILSEESEEIEELLGGGLVGRDVFAVDVVRVLDVVIEVALEVFIESIEWVFETGAGDYPEPF
jgi:hypothetical protein